MLSELAERLRSNNFEFLAQQELAAAAAVPPETIFGPQETAIIFDWDDTLFPTWRRGL